MIGAKRPKMLRLAATHGDIWGWFVEERSDLSEFGPRLAALEAACADVGRDPATISRSAGLAVEPTSVSGAADVLGEPIRGSAARIADAFREFHTAGFDHIEVVLWPPTLPALEAMAPVVGLLSDIRER